MNKKCLAGFLQGKNRRTLPTKSSIPISIVASSIGNHVKRNLAHLLTRQHTWIKTRGMINIRHVRRAQRGAFAGASPCSSDTSESREARQCPVCTAVFLVRARLDQTWNFGLRACGGWVWEGGTTNHAKQYKTRQCTRLTASSQSRFGREYHIRCLDGPARGTPLPPSPLSLPSSSPSPPPPPPPPPPPDRLCGGSRPPVDLRAVCA